MKIETKFHGSIEVEKDQVWQFPKGMPGFEKEKEFVLLPVEGNDVFQVLQSVKTPTVAFIVGNPYIFTENYSLNIDEPTIEFLKIKRAGDVFILGILSVKDPFDSSTINLQAPLIFQSNTKKAKQMILNDSIFSMRHPIVSQVTVAEGKA